MSFRVVSAIFYGDTNLCSLHDNGTELRVFERSAAKRLLIRSTWRENHLTLPVFFSHVTNVYLAADYS